MTTATRILKTDPRNDSASRVRLTDLSEPIGSRFESSAFEPLTLPIGPPSRCEQQVDSRLDSALAALQRVADRLHAQQDDWLDRNQQEAVRLGVAVAERLLRRTLAIQPEAIFDLIRSALEWSVGTDHLRVHLHPADAGLVADAALPHDAERKIEFLPDASLTRGDCLIESLNGQTDARLEVILQRITDELLAE